MKARFTYINKRLRDFAISRGFYLFSRNLAYAKFRENKVLAKISKFTVLYFLSLRINNVLANSADPDEMLHFVASYLGLQCLQKYLFRGFQLQPHSCMTFAVVRV